MLAPREITLREEHSAWSPGARSVLVSRPDPRARHESCG